MQGPRSRYPSLSLTCSGCCTYRLEIRDNLSFKLIRAGAMESPRCKRRRLQKQDSTSQVADDASVMLTASSRVAIAEDFVSGAWLEKFAADNLSGFQAFLGQEEALGPLGHGPGRLTLTWGSACSGSEGAYFVMHALSDAFEEAKMDVTLVHKFSCESDKRKRQWIRSVVANGRATHSRTSLTGNSEAWCDVHTGRPCQIPPVDVLMIGTRCEDLSKLNGPVDRKKLVLFQATSKGGSAQTHRFKDYVASHAPLMIVYENVDAIDDKVSAAAETNLSLLMREMLESSECFVLYPVTMTVTKACTKSIRRLKPTTSMCP